MNARDSRRARVRLAYLVPLAAALAAPTLPLAAAEGEDQFLSRSRQLILEGRRMNHCVGSYVGKCLNGQASIWSLRCRNGDQWRSCVTIEVNPASNTIVQARRYANQGLTEQDWDKINQWAAMNSLKL